MRTLLAIVPSAGVLFLFWLAIRAMLQADRRERAAQIRHEALVAEAERSTARPVNHTKSTEMSTEMSRETDDRGGAGGP